LKQRKLNIAKDIDMARERFLADKRHLQAIITNPEASVKDKLAAINSDIQLNITLLKLEYEGRLFVKNQLTGGSHHINPAKKSPQILNCNKQI